MKKTFDLFQIKLTDDEVDMVNAHGHSSVEKQEAKIEMTFALSEKIYQLAEDAMANGFYTKVAKIKANDLEDMFRVGNLGVEDQIERLGSMASPSVGDVVFAEGRGYYVIAPFGFTKMADADAGKVVTA